MTARLETQTTALESRRALIEAVMSGVTAGVISIDSDRTVQLVNSSAVALLDSGGGDPVGRPLAVLSAELDALLESDKIGKHTSELQSIMRISYDVFCLK